MTAPLHRGIGAAALTIGGLDPSGCYGLSADIRTFLALGVHAASVVTILTAQNTAGLRSAKPVETDFIVAQAEAVLDDLAIGSTKTGMLATLDTVEAVARLHDRGRLPCLVVDPVLVDHSGNALFDHSVADAYRRLLGPRAAVFTPNAHEAALLLGRPITDPTSMAAAALALGRESGTTVVVTSGSLHGFPADDAWYDPQRDGVFWLTGQRISTNNVAGSGDTFSAAISAALAQGYSVNAALSVAKGFVEAALLGGVGWRLGAGSGPLDHFGWSTAASEANSPT